MEVMSPREINITSIREIWETVYGWNSVWIEWVVTWCEAASWGERGICKSEQRDGWQQQVRWMKESPVSWLLSSAVLLLLSWSYLLLHELVVAIPGGGRKGRSLSDALMREDSLFTAWYWYSVLWNVTRLHPLSSLSDDSWTMTWKDVTKRGWMVKARQILFDVRELGIQQQEVCIMYNSGVRGFCLTKAVIILQSVAFISPPAFPHLSHRRYYGCIHHHYMYCCRSRKCSTFLLLLFIKLADERQKSESTCIPEEQPSDGHIEGKKGSGMQMRPDPFGLQRTEIAPDLSLMSSSFASPQITSDIFRFVMLYFSARKWLIHQRFQTSDGAIQQIYFIFLSFCYIPSLSWRKSMEWMLK